MLHALTQDSCCLIPQDRGGSCLKYGVSLVPESLTPLVSSGAWHQIRSPAVLVVGVYMVSAHVVLAQGVMARGRPPVWLSTGHTACMSPWIGVCKQAIWTRGSLYIAQLRSWGNPLTMRGVAMGEATPQGEDKTAAAESAEEQLVPASTTVPSVRPPVQQHTSHLALKLCGDNRQSKLLCAVTTA